MKKTRKGFTLVELLVVIAILAILATVAVVGYTSFTKKANESADIQAVTQINTHLTAITIVEPIGSILDVYDYFEESGFELDGYKPLYEGRSFYYDKQYNQILYVDDETGKVIFPKEHENETKAANHDWFSLSMEIVVDSVDPVVADGVAKYSVGSAAQYAYIAEQLNGNNWASDKVVIELTADIDFMGAYVTVAEIPAGKSITIQSAGDAKYTMKNMTSNQGLNHSTQNSDNVNKLYTASALIGKVGANSSVTIKNVVLANLNVKNTYAGNVALLVGETHTTSTATFENIEIKDSNVVGHRSVGSLIGMFYGTAKTTDVVFTNVTVGTVGGRSGLVFGFMTMANLDGDLDVEYTGCKVYIYECNQNAGGIEDYTITEKGHNATKKITSQYDENDPSKVKTYGFHDKALYCKYNPQDTATYYLYELMD